MARVFRRFAVFTFIIMITTGDVSANYTFLGNVERYERTQSGVIVHCEGNNLLKIEFLLPTMFRILLIRNDYTEPPLTYALAKTAWNPVSIELQNESTEIIIRSSQIVLNIHKQPCRLTVKDRNGIIINQDDEGMGIGWDGKEVKCWKTITHNEKFFGLGEKTGTLDKRGQEWVMWNSDTYAYGNGTDPVYQSIPFFIGIRDYKAYGIFFNNSYRSKFNFGAGNLRYYSFSAEQGNLDYFFIYGPEIRTIVETYTELTGRMPLPPLWALGYQQSRYSYYPDSTVLKIARTFREKNIPADVIYLDIHYMDGYRLFTWDKNRFPDPAGMVHTLDNMGFKVAVIIDPGIKDDASYPIAQEGITGNYFVKYPDGNLYIGEVWPGKTYFPDFSRPETRVWWGNLFTGFLNIGIKGFWTDMNEPAVWGKAFPEETIFYDEGSNSSHKKMHNLYGLLMAQATYEGLKRLRSDERPFVITRAGFSGVQRFASAWTGDNIATDEHLELGIRMMLGMGLSGEPFIGTDVGGFVGTPTPQLFARWIQVGMLSPFFRTHTTIDTKDQEPWSFGNDVEAISKRYITKRYELLPYLYSLIYEASTNGAPLWRPLFWYYQNDSLAYSPAYQNEFFVGENLLAAPVVRGQTNRYRVYFPAGKWLDWNTETIYSGPAAVQMNVPLDILPLFIKEGGIILSGEPMQYVGEKSIQTLTADIFPAASSGEFLLYEDDGRTFEYLQNIYRITKLECHQNGTTVEYNKIRLYDRYNPPERMLTVKFHAFDKEVNEILLDNTPLKAIQSTEKKAGYYYDNEKKTLVVKFNDMSREQRIVIR